MSTAGAWARPHERSKKLSVSPMLPKCDFIVYFVYDSAETPTNPRGIEVDLSKIHGNEVLVVIEP